MRRAWYLSPLEPSSPPVWGDRPTSILWPFILQNQVCGLWDTSMLVPTYLSLLGEALAVVCRPKAMLSPQAEPQPVAFRGSCTAGPAFAHQTLLSSQTKQRCSDRNRPKERPRPAVLQGGSHHGPAKANDSFTKGIILESSSSGPVIQEESSAAVILGSFHLNCCKEQFFHDKQIASVPQQQWGGVTATPSLHSPSCTGP